MTTTSSSSTPTTGVTVPLLDLKQQFASLRPELLQAVTEVLDSQACVNGPAIAAFEAELAELCGVAGAVGVSSGTDALLCALMALDIGEGDEVITTPFTFFSTAGSIWRLGARPVFVDIEPDTFNIDATKIEAAINDRTRAVMPVHLFGQCADMDPIIDLAKSRDLRVIEDAAQAISATYKGRSAGSMGDVGCFSFFPSKNLGGAGDGGACVAAEAELVEKIRVIRAHGSKTRYLHERVGGNFRLDTLQAAYLSVKLRRLDQWSEGRRQNAAYYHESLGDLEQVVTPTVREHNVCIYNQFVIRAERRDELAEYLKDHGVGTAIYYPLSLHQQACFRDLGYREGDLPESERAAKQVLALPIFPELTEAQLGHVVDTIRRFYARG